MSDCYKLISSFFRVYFKRMPANITKHRDYIKFSAESNPINWTKNLKFLAYKKATNPCNSLNKKKNKKIYLEKATENGITGSKMFWSTFTPFLLSKGFIHNDNISNQLKLIIKLMNMSLN